MAALLAATTADMQRRGHVLSLLGGDRRLYRGHGWALGGVVVQYTLVASYLPAPPDPADVRSMSPDELVRTLVSHRDALRSSFLLPDFELSLLVAARRHGAVRLGESWVVHDARRETVYFAGGDAQDIARLLAYLLAQAPARGPHQRHISVECADEASALSLACMRHHRNVQRRPACMWRIGGLVPFLSGACRMAAHRVGAGSDKISLVNTDTGEAATLECREGELAVREGAEGRAYEFGTAALSELVFASDPLEHILPDLRADSPLRRVIPIRAHHSWFFPI